MFSEHATSIVKENCLREDFTAKISNINFLSELENFDTAHKGQREKKNIYGEPNKHRKINKDR